MRERNRKARTCKDMMLHTAYFEIDSRMYDTIHVIVGKTNQ